MTRVSDHFSFYFYRALYTTTARSQWLLRYLQHRRFEQLLEVTRQIPFWQERLHSVHSLRDLPKVTPIDRELLRQRIRDAVNPRIPIQRFFQVATTGSTGEPFIFYRDSTEQIPQRARALRAYTWVGWRRGDRIIRTFASHARFSPYWSILTEDDPTRISNIEYRARIYRTLTADTPVLLYSFPSFVLSLAPYWKRDRPNVQFRSIILAGEDFTMEAQQYLERVFSAPIRRAYSAKEFGEIGFECRERRGFHISAENFFVEIMDEYGHPCYDKWGTILITSFSNMAMPFIRYRIGDIGRLQSRPCPCGIVLPLLELRGRETAIFRFADGSPLYLVEVHRAVIEQAGTTVRQFQIYQDRNRMVSLLIVPGQGYSTQIERRLIERLRELEPKRNTIQLKKVTEIPLRNGLRKLAFYSAADQVSLK